MSKKKIYFSEMDDEFCHPIPYLLKEMEDRELTETKVHSAKVDYDSDYGWCKAFSVPLEKRESGCGKECKHYEPRNGKSGCCKEYGYCYLPDQEYTLNINGKLTKNVN